MYSLIRNPQISQITQIFSILAILGLFWLTGCQTAAPPAAPTSAATTAVASQPTATSTPSQTPTVTPAPTVTPTATPTATPTPTVTPSPTPIPLAQLIVPERWELAAQTAVAQLEAEETNWRWQISVNDAPDPDNLPANAVWLTTGDEGLLIAARPLAIVVPFATAWEQISLSEAQAVIANGHRLAQVMDYAEMTPNNKALRVGGLFPHEADYPLQAEWRLAGDNGAAAAIAPALAAQLAPERLIHLTAVGDIMLARSLGVNLQGENRLYPFVGVVEALQAADITVGNVESALGNIGEPAPKAYPFRAPPEAAESLALAGFDIVSLANNHAMDYGPDALLQAISLLEAQGVAAIGAGANSQAARAPHIVEVHGIRLAFLAYVNVPVEWRGFDTRSWEATADSPGMAWGDPELIAEDVAAVRPSVDLVVVILHSGLEYIEEPSPPQVAASRAAIDAGADLVVGHHAHLLQGIEFYNGKVIAYGLGNFAFEIDGAPETALLNVWLDRNGVRQLEIVPAIIRFGGQPRLAHDWEAPAIRENVYRLTRLLNPR
jgi:poly-gamma-glutamate capsule biosynthesis protein CapA/YwtB (metallophosphatase superfamily)